MPQKKYIVRLTAQEREVCQETLRTLNGSSEKVRRAQMLLKADADGPAWTDQEIADAFSCRTKTVENIRQRCVQEGFERALERTGRTAGEARVSSTALPVSSPCTSGSGYGNATAPHAPTAAETGGARSAKYVRH